MRLALISDAHLFQSFIKEKYDSIEDFSRVLAKISEIENPDALIMLGDMFDYKKTKTIYLRHYEGEAMMIKIRRILRDFKRPIFALRGNHEKEDVLKGLQQTVDNFYYIKNNCKVLGDIQLCFMDTHYQEGLYDPVAVGRILEKKAIKWVKKDEINILFLHESFPPSEDALPISSVKKLAQNFDWIFNGHMHSWNRASYGISNVFTLPSLLPSRVILGKYWMEQYTWSSKSKLQVNTRRSPFGYVIVDTEEKNVELREFLPSKKIIEIRVDVSNLSLEQSREVFKNILDKISQRKDRNKLIILPEIHGEANFLSTFIKDFLGEYKNLDIEELRDNTIFKIKTETGESLPYPVLKIENLSSEIKRKAGELAHKISEEIGISVDSKSIVGITENILSQGLLEPSRQKITKILQALIELVFDEIKLEKPDEFKENLENIVAKVKL